MGISCHWASNYLGGVSTPQCWAFIGNSVVEAVSGSPWNLAQQTFLSWLSFRMPQVSSKDYVLLQGTPGLRTMGYLGQSFQLCFLCCSTPSSLYYPFISQVCLDCVPSVFCSLFLIFTPGTFANGMSERLRKHVRECRSTVALRQEDSNPRGVNTHKGRHFTLVIHWCHLYIHDHTTNNDNENNNNYISTFQLIFCQGISNYLAFVIQLPCKSVFVKYDVFL